MSSNTFLQIAVVALVIAHAGSLVCVWFAPWGVNFLLGLNAVIAIGVLIYGASRMRFIIAAADWPYVGLLATEALVLPLSLWAMRGHRGALICSAVAFGLHALASIAATVFAFGFKFNKLI